MMKKIAVLILMVFAGAITALPQGLEEILSQHAKVMGCDPSSSLNTFKITGKNLGASREMSFIIYVKGPKIRYESEFMDRKIIQVFNGEKGWVISPRNNEPVEMSSRQVEMLKQRAALGGPLCRWKDHIENLVLEGKDDFEGSEVFKLRYNRPDGNKTWYYLDTESYVLLKMSDALNFNGNQVVRSTVFSDYKKVEGMLVAFSRVTTTEGAAPAGGRGGQRGRPRGGGEVRYTKVSVNVPVDDRLFTRESLK